MWSLFRSAATRSAPLTRARLSLEPLDWRATPSSLIDPLTGAPSSDSEYIAYDRSANQAPQIINFGGGQESGNIWIISGDVVDEAPGGLTVTLGGDPVTLRGQTLTTDANGHFELAVALNTDGTDDGRLTAQTTDAQGLASNLAEASIRPSA